MKRASYLWQITKPDRRTASDHDDSDGRDRRRIVQRGIDTPLTREGRIDTVLNNDGIAWPGPLEATSIEEAKRQPDVTLFGACRVCRAVLPIMRRQGGGPS